MALILILIIAVIVLCFIDYRFFIFLINPRNDVHYGIRDLWDYFVHKLYNVPPDGKLVALTGYFGAGKTLSGVYLANQYAKRYHGKKYFKDGHWRTVNVVILSNVSMTPEKGSVVFLDSLQQIVTLAHSFYDFDRQNHTHTCLFVLADELGANMNSRSFKSNIDPDFLNTLLTCRKFHINLYYMTQRFFLTDKLLRDVTQDVLVSLKLWRLVRLDRYDAWEMENSQNPEAIRRRGVSGYFATNKLFAMYDTLAMVGKLEKSCNDKDRLSDQEILALRTGDSDINRVARPSRKWRKARK